MVLILPCADNYFNLLLALGQVYVVEDFVLWFCKQDLHWVVAEDRQSPITTGDRLKITFVSFVSFYARYIKLRRYKSLIITEYFVHLNTKSCEIDYSKRVFTYNNILKLQCKIILSALVLTAVRTSESCLKIEL